jgi:pyruvyltransferase
MGKSLRLYWWSEIYIQKKAKENYGDLLGKYIVEKISKKNVRWVRAPKFHFQNLFQPLYVTIGSVLAHINTYCTVWGSGINHKDEAIAGGTFLAVRGPLSRKRIQELGYDCPEIYGDPALLLPLYYSPTVPQDFEMGIVPHISDLEMVKELFKDADGIKIIDFNTNDIEVTTKEILKCKNILSSSLHGIILAHAYQIPAVQVQFSDLIFGDGVKYHDYFLSVDLKVYVPTLIEQTLSKEAAISLIQNHESSLPSSQKINQIQNDLLAACPFKNSAL